MHQDSPNLSKQWWDELHAINPEAVDRFCKWIDEYKRDNYWLSLFNSGIRYETLASRSDCASGRCRPRLARVTTEAPKFHDIPLAMQVGILQEYFGYSIDEGLDSMPEYDIHATGASCIGGFAHIIKHHFINGTIPQRELTPA